MKAQNMLRNLLLDDNCKMMLMRPVYQEGVCSIIPELRRCIGYDQKNKYHDKDLFLHTLHTVVGCEKDFTTRMAALLHDIGKPSCMSVGKDGHQHYRGHGKVSAAIAEDILQRLGVDNDQTQNIVQLIEYHDHFIEETPEFMEELYRKLGYKQCMRLMDLRQADVLAQGPLNREERVAKARRIKAFFEEKKRKEERE